MMRSRALLLAIPLCSAVASMSLAQTPSDQTAPAPAAPAQAAPAQAAPAQAGNAAAQAPTGLLFDPAQLPAFRGKVAQYSLAPRGGPDGLILDDGSQVSVNHRLSAQLVALVKPGDAVTIHGVRAQSGSLILALSVGNDASGKTLITERRHGMRRTPIVAQGKIKSVLRNRHDEVDGVLLEDGSQIRIWPGEARRLAGQLTPGQTIYASGYGQESLLGKVVVPRRIGTTEAEATELRRPPFVHFMGYHGLPGRPPGMDRPGDAGMRRGPMDRPPGGGMDRPMRPQPDQPGGAPAAP